MNDEQPISFVGKTASDSTTERVEEFEHSGVLTRLKAVTHQGQQYALRQYAYLIRDGGRVPIWQSLDQEYLAGNGQVYELPIRFEFQKGDKLVLKAENVNTSGNTYHHNMTVNIDYETSSIERIAGALRGVV